MKGRAIVPMADFNRRMPRAGKLKLGQKTEKAMKKLSTFRAVSPYEDCIRAIAQQYGGTAVPYHDATASPKDQWEVVTEANRMEVFLIPDGLDACYEQWKGGGCVRRCDGETVEVQVPDGDDYRADEYPCLCVSEGRRSCDPKLRISVIMPNIPLRGSWLLETKSWNAAAEMPGMFDLIVELSQRGGMKRAELGIQLREEMKAGKKRQFVVPVLSMVETPMELTAGMADVKVIAAGNNAAGIGRGSQPALGAGTPVVVRSPEPEQLADDDIAEAEIIDPAWLALEAGVRKDAEWFGLDPERFLAAVLTQAAMVVKGKEPSEEERQGRVTRCRQQMADGEREPLGFLPDGKIDWQVAT